MKFLPNSTSIISHFFYPYSCIKDYQQDIIDKLSYHVYPALPPSPNQAAALAKIFSKLETERLNRLSSSLSSSSSSSSAVSSTTSTTADIAYGENVLADDQRLEYTHYKKMEAEW